jgi:hypothetical protein
LVDQIDGVPVATAAAVVVVSVTPASAALARGTSVAEHHPLPSDLDEWISPGGEWKAPKRLSLLAE